MRLIKNVGADRVIDELRSCLEAGTRLDIASSAFSLFAFAELQESLAKVEKCRIALATEGLRGDLLGSDGDRPFRNRLLSRWLARRCAEWVRKKVEVRFSALPLPQSALISDHPESGTRRAIHGNCPLTTEGLGVTPGARFGMTLSSEAHEEWKAFDEWFATLWSSLPTAETTKNELLHRLDALAAHKTPSHVYALTLFHLFKDLGEELDEERIVRSATGIRDTVVWKKLFRFQRDGVVGAIDKLERLHGCIIADSVGLGKTFEALAVIKYYELRNDRVLVLCPKRLRDNWTVYKSNDSRNVLAADRFHYDVLNHSDLSRDGGMSGDINLSNVKWGNYDLVVIDESHNFRNKAAHRGRDTRYDRLMNRIIQAGVKTKVLMLSATPVNNRLADLKNQIAFITEGNDSALFHHGLPSVEATTRQAQMQFNLWLKMDESQRRPAVLLDMLGFDYFKLLDLLTIARSRKHIEKYYGTTETGRFPERLPPINIKADIDAQAQAGVGDTFPPIRDINDEIRRLTLGAYTPLSYVLEHKKAAYDEKYSTEVREGKSIFKQADREESLVHLMRVNILKRMESSVSSFRLTLQRLLADVTSLIDKIDRHLDPIEELPIEEVEIDDPEFEALLIGRKVKVLLQDVDRRRWRQDLAEDQERLASLLHGAEHIGPDRDDKIAQLRRLIADKVANPINPGNRKIIVFTAFADTADYLYSELSGWARDDLGLHTAKVTGAGANRTTLPGLRTDLGTILTAFAPRSKGRPAEAAAEGELDLLIATDCISEGQNLQDCDYLVNYDIHWNPVRIIQRFGRIDRIGSPNRTIQLVNFWPNMELNEYINLEQRVSGRMALLDISATGEENLIDPAGNRMNDLEYRRKQLQKLQETVIDLEDLSNGISITDLTLTDFRIELAAALKADPDRLTGTPLGGFAVTTARGVGDAAIPPGIVFCLRAAGDAAQTVAEPGYPLAPHYLVHVGVDGAVLLPFTQAKAILDRMRTLCIGHDVLEADACHRFDALTRDGRDMTMATGLLAKAVSSIIGKGEERAAASLFSPGGTHGRKGEFQGINDFEVVAFLVILPDGVSDGRAEEAAG
ncbi:helicase [Azospirillum sp. 412522]|nr:helicase-related protein [Azospirillum sp. 412522]MBY6260843.1 helicase [Azospirillum sp. 412522]